MSINETAFDARAFRQVAGDLYASAAVTEAEVEAARQNMLTLKKAAAEKRVALYKIEVQFGRNHHVNGESTYGMLTLWESGTKLHGGGDAMLYVCPGKYMKRNDCEHVIPDAVNGRSVVVCPSCLTAWSNQQLIGQHAYRFSIQTWAEVIQTWFLRLDMNADLRIKYFYDDIRAASAAEQEKELRGELLEKARAAPRRISRVYLLNDLIKEVNAGASMYTRILAFLRT